MAKEKNYRFMHLFQLAISLAGDKDIVTTDLKLKYSDNKEYADLIILQEKWEKIIDWNFYTIDYHLNELKKKLMRYKSYVMCGHAPENYKNYVSKGE